ncbi:recombinational protein T [Weissella oryzae SG25]|uniref:Recombinational protein T n=1 Tax=Weissella oryzae (strain DSM 25784 / JCM 18191 / LMG 30913 / SG25) TaxID=1329250 RepID=A0A069CVN0_WEIOS|nr:recombinase RecT [Weissella oryzae]GAK31825.1 recombinational protein T [Weissella oryzae SG25]
MSNNLTSAQYFNAPNIKGKFEEVLGKNANGYVTSLLSVINGSQQLQRAEPSSIMVAAMKAATLNLPIESSLGFAYIVPYGNNAQFQIGYKGLIQLALRSGQIKGLNSGVVYETQFISYDPLFEELEIDFKKPAEGKIAGYFASMKLTNGFSKVVYWTKEQVEQHRDRFSKGKNNGPWKSDFDAMAQKTVMKAMISKYAPLNQEMQQAIVEDSESELTVPRDVTTSNEAAELNSLLTTPKVQEGANTDLSEPFPNAEETQLFDDLASVTGD